MNLVLARAKDDGGCTLGVLRLGSHTWQTIERPWVNNQKGVSCIPPGEYRLEKHDTEAHPKTWALINVALGVLHWPDARYPLARTACLIHPANTSAELRGCIAPGLTRGEIGGMPAVLSSRAAMLEIQAALPWTDEHTLTVNPVPPLLNALNSPSARRGGP